MACHRPPARPVIRFLGKWAPDAGTQLLKELHLKAALLDVARRYARRFGGHHRAVGLARPRERKAGRTLLARTDEAIRLVVRG